MTTNTEKKIKTLTFGKVFWASLLASLAVLMFIFIFFFGILGSLFIGPEPFSIEENTILHMRLGGEIGEMSNSEFDPIGFGGIKRDGLSDLLFGIEKAKNDDRVKGIFLELDGGNYGYSTASEIRAALDSFQNQSGKFVVSYLKGEAVGLKQYYLSSVSSENYGFPSTMFEFGGLGAELMFFKRMFDKLDIEMQVIRGSNNDFKSAVEPFFLERMSDSSKHQLQRYLNSMWEDIRYSIGSSRSISIEELNNYAENSVIRRMRDAMDYHLIDGIKYRDEMMQLLMEKVGASSEDEFKLVSIEKFASKKFENDQKIIDGRSDANIAVIIAEGEVSTSGDGVASSKITKLFRAVRENDTIKSVVFRINSPGGSALASDEIWREVMLTKEVKPVIVSMGDVAASGGYYIAAPATRIFAQPMTITGSIGVFGVIPYTGAMLENKLGLTFDRVGTNSHAVLSLNKKLTDEEFQIVQDEVDFIYDEFLMRVSEGRGMSKTAVNQIARGRVWTGKDAIEIGLVDELGGLEDAVRYAAINSNIDEPIVQYFPKLKKEAIQEVLETLADQEEEEANTEIIPQELMNYYKKLKSLENYTGIQARMPYQITIQ